ncbi:MAG: hypothetical protein MUE41_14090 [Gemmatimonadaceae bacterium]|nr:hypothetical protein [Gemmatimonadaceae bacterium]
MAAKRGKASGRTVQRGTRTQAQPDINALLEELRVLVAAVRASAADANTDAATSGHARPRGRPATVREGRVRKEFWLDPDVLADAKSFYNAATEREAVERALEQAAWTARVVRSVHALEGLDIEDPEAW